MRSFPYAVRAETLFDLASLTKPLCTALLVVNDSYFPGWIAQVDGQDTPLYRADGNFRAVVVPVGDHTVGLRVIVWVVLGAFALLTILHRRDRTAKDDSGSTEGRE